MSRRTWGLAAVVAAAVLGLDAGRWVAPARATYRDWSDLLQFLTSPAVREIPLRMERARTIVEMVRTGALEADRSGRINLPPSFASVTKDGRVYVTRKRDGSLLILFPTWQGKGANVRGYLFCSRPLVQGDAIDRIYNPFGPPSAVPVGVTVERRVSASWYSVSRSLD